uniref:Predicted protein n=1 Tax=Hordeum vulgare subsp. vulgare TaxID=112509 RepID=F2EIK7_HORVV|nr:predicted protein [Hordeum vulgare subsp. vulgare]
MLILWKLSMRSLMLSRCKCRTSPVFLLSERYCAQYPLLFVILFGTEKTKTRAVYPWQPL